MKKFNYTFGACLFLLITFSCHQEKDIQLFDGETFSGWEGSESVFRIENNAIIGGSLDKKLENTSFLCTTEEYSDFELTFSAKIVHPNPQTGNTGIYFRAHRNESNRVKVGGYEADMGYIEPSAIAKGSDYSPLDMSRPFSLWGSLIDEGREDPSRYANSKGKSVMPLKFADRELIEKIVKPNDWNEVKVIADGNELEMKINGITTAKYTEEGNVPSKGFICLQIHKEPYEVHFKDIRIRKIY